MCRVTRIVLCLFACLGLWTSAAHAQASITGVVKDASGAVLPGVVVEAASPALIEKVRSVVTDGTGQYRIIDLRPGVYTVTYTLPGFNTVNREGVQLTGSFAATIDVELRIGALEETITVSGETPTVDVQAVTQQRVMDKDVLDAIPTGRTHFTATVLLPGVTSSQSDVGGANSLALTNMSIHGGTTSDTRVSVDGVSTQNAELEGNSSNYMTNMGTTQEVTVDYAAGSAEQAYAGLKINLIPREGGNTFTGSFYGTFANDKFESDNYSDELRQAGLATPNSLKRMYDYNPVLGGPLMRDKAWFFAGFRWVENNKYVAGRYFNANAGDPTKWTYVPDTSQQAFERITQQSGNVRVTWQATQKNKFAVFYDQQGRCWCNWFGFGVPNSPEAANRLEWPVNRLTSGSWTSPVTSRLLLEARYSDRAETYDYAPIQFSDAPNYDLIQVTEQSTGIIYRSMGAGNLVFQVTDARVRQAVANVSYVTGAHSFKAGFSDVWIDRHTNVRDNNFHVAYRFNNGIPNQLTMRALPWEHVERQKAELGIYAQDRWTIDRLTLNMGVRFDWYSTYYPEQYLGPVPLAPARDLRFPETDGVNFKDITPRVGVAYDLFGNGKTAIKGNVGRYPISVGIAQGIFGEAINPAARTALFTTRSWNDANRNFVPDCVLTNLEQNGECARADNLNFGKPVLSTNYADTVMRGWGVRQYQWEFSGAIQHELMPRLSASLGYFRRVFGNFLVTDNLAVAPTDYSPFSITAPVDSRLPDGGGYLITDLYDLNPDKVGQVNNLLRPAGDFGKQIQHWNGIDVTVDARLGNGVILQGGVSTGRTSTDNCDVMTKVDNPSRRFCHVDTKFLTQTKLLGVYRIPKIDLSTAATFQSTPGPQIAANYNTPNSLVQPSLGRPLSGGAANVTVNLVEPGTMYGEWTNQLDLRFSRPFAFSGVRTTVNLDLYNALNSNDVRSLNNNYAVWLTPTAILSGRLTRFSVQVDF
jgi:hypothetical protein